MTLSFVRLVSLGVAGTVAGCVSTTPRVGVLSARPGPNGHRVIAIPAGEYRVGADGNHTNPRRKVQLKRFWISDAETTNEEFSRFVAMTGYKTDAEQRGYGMVALE